MTKLRIKAARVRYEERTGETMSQRRLAGLLWPDEKQSSREIKISNLELGKSKRIDIKTANRIAEILGVDLNFLFNK